ncbi:uncharacterized protein ACHE_31043S [Aspergillus chevalieri]|uniref:Tachykinin family protein n=1 Tax=Aspergillus chevalieri TaxID=182096 RepID=A0A7R7VLZ9_ASPCH|nr:uncharacterized protein ACHE_31043S [Aspergillus chevalieri]BCR87056.1 hypothetical protein ACHE_31043S [Aspergillus chevalieri]
MQKASVMNAVPTHPFPAVDRPTFTFIDHDQDFSSKRIKNVKSRKAIRSHVMRDVRRRERLAGLKRGSKREAQLQKLPKPAPAHIVPDSSEDSSSDQATSCWSSSSPSSSSSSSSSSPPQVTESSVDLVLRQPKQQFLTQWGASNPLNGSSSNPVSQIIWELDPFSTLQCVAGMPSMVPELILYYETVYVPTTFPNAQNGSKQANKALTTTSAFSDAGSFFGLMSMCAAHRAILSGRHSDLIDAEGSSRSLYDPDYYIMKDRCIREMEAKVRDPNRALSNEAFDTIVSLLTSALIVGLFSEIRIHLKGLKHMVDMRGGITARGIRGSSIWAAIVVVDIKAASGLMTTPVFPLAWGSKHVPVDVQERIQPPEFSLTNRFGNALCANTLLSCSLRRVIHAFRGVAFYSEAIQTNPFSLQPKDHEFFRLFICEIEHRFVSYVDSESEVTVLHPIEAVTRTAAICYLNNLLIVSPPSTGLGRALTKHLKSAANKCTLPLLAQLPEENAVLLAWALFIGAQGSTGQIEHDWFIEQLATIAVICGWSHWDQVSDSLSEYLYVSQVQSPIWKTIWDKVVAFVPTGIIGAY